MWRRVGLIGETPVTSATKKCRFHREKSFYPEYIGPRPNLPLSPAGAEQTGRRMRQGEHGALGLDNSKKGPAVFGRVTDLKYLCLS